MRVRVRVQVCALAVPQCLPGVEGGVPQDVPCVAQP